MLGTAIPPREETRHEKPRVSTRTNIEDLVAPADPSRSDDNSLIWQPRLSSVLKLADLLLPSRGLRHLLEHRLLSLFLVHPASLHSEVDQVFVFLLERQ